MNGKYIHINNIKLSNCTLKMLLKIIKKLKDSAILPSIIGMALKKIFLRAVPNLL